MGRVLYIAYPSLKTGSAKSEQTEHETAPV
jgi:hypothetical protein